MKNLFLSISILISVLNCKAQSNIINFADTATNNAWSSQDGNTYIKDINNLMNPYVGTWKWAQGNREMTLTLIKQSKHHYTQGGQNYYEDRLVGYYIYKENGVVIANTSSDNLNADYRINVIFTLNTGLNIVSLSFEDVYKDKRYSVSLELLSPTQMKFHGKEDETTYIRPRNGTKYYSTSSTFPLEMTFIKQ